MNYPWACQSCGATEEVERPMSQSHVGPTDHCSACNALDWRRIYEAPMIMERALPDGSKRAGFHREKEAAKLDVQAASAPPKQAIELKRAAAERRRSKE